MTSVFPVLFLKIGILTPLHLGNLFWFLLGGPFAAVGLSQLFSSFASFNSDSMLVVAVLLLLEAVGPRNLAIARMARCALCGVSGHNIRGCRLPGASDYRKLRAEQHARQAGIYCQLHTRSTPLMIRSLSP